MPVVTEKAAENLADLIYLDPVQIKPPLHRLTFELIFTPYIRSKRNLKNKLHTLYKETHGTTSCTESSKNILEFKVLSLTPKCLLIKHRNGIARVATSVVQCTTCTLIMSLVFAQIASQIAQIALILLVDCTRD